MTFEEKERAYSQYVADIAESQGMVFIEDSGEGRDLLLPNMYVEDISGWLSPKDIPDGERKNDKYYCFAEWKMVDGEVKVDFVKYETY